MNAELRDILRRLRTDALIYAGILVALVWLLLLMSLLTGHAHDNASWIQMQRLRNAVGEWCCGPNDCDSVESFSDSAAGYVVRPSGETIPYEEVAPISPDGKLWVCRRPDNTRRCVFGPSQGS